MLAVEHEVLVDLVGDGDEVMGDAHPSDGGQLVRREHLARRVVRRVQQHEPGPLGDQVLERGHVSGVVGRDQRHGP